MDRQLETHDLRFLRYSAPTLQFTGHVNSYTEKLGIAVDPGHNFVFAAGQDRCLRAWSLHTAQQLLPHPIHRDADTTFLDTNTGFESRSTHFLGKTFEASIPVLQVTEDREGLCLWAVAGTEMYMCRLGVSNDGVLDDDARLDGWHLG